MTDHATRDTKPHDLLTGIGNDMLTVLERRMQDEDCKHCREGYRGIVMIMAPGEDGRMRGGVAIAGYEDDAQALADMLMHVRGVLRSLGKDLQIIGLPVGGTPQ